MDNEPNSITIFWTDERKVGLVIRFVHQWSWDDVYLAHEKANRMIREQDQEVDVIYDFQKTKTLPSNYFRHLKKIHDDYPYNTGMVLLVSANRLVTELVRSVTRNYRDMARRYAFVDTLEEAYAVVGP
jgi:hypothetical protein